MKYSAKIPQTLLMLAGCAAMLIAIFTLTSSSSESNWGLYLLLMLCPAMHIFMHRGLHRNEDLHKSLKTTSQTHDTQRIFNIKQKNLPE